MASSYLVLTHKEDAHLPFVEKHLDQPLLRLGPGDVAAGRALSFRMTPEGVVTTWDDQKLQAVRSIWLRYPLLFSEDLPLSGQAAQYAHQTIETTFAQLYGQWPQALWVSDHFAVLRASNKVLQMDLAQKLGFNVPATLITSDKIAARQFLEDHPKSVIKLIRTFAVSRPDGQRDMVLTRWAEPDVDLSTLHLAPAIFQQAIDVGAELRVTVVGRQVFAASIAGSAVDDPDNSIRDWRVVNYAGSTDIRAVELPKPVAQLCRQFVRQQGLAMGVLDLILDKRGKYWFLENNPLGQWAFVEEATGQPIGQAVANLLMRGKRSR